jgi:hypothetical protein
VVDAAARGVDKASFQFDPKLPLARCRAMTRGIKSAPWQPAAGFCVWAEFRSHWMLCQVPHRKAWTGTLVIKIRSFKIASKKTLDIRSVEMLHVVALR